MQTRHSTSRIRSAPFLAVAVIASIAACGNGRREATAAADSLSRGNPADNTQTNTPGDSAGIRRDQVSGQTGGGSTDSTLLVKLANHHQALLELAQAAEQKAQGTVKKDAQEIASDQRSEQRQILNVLQSNFHASYRPQAMPDDRAMTDSLAQLSGPAYARSFYAMVVRHHQEGLRMIDSAAPSLTDSTVRALTEKLKKSNAREIADLRRKTTAAT